MARITRDAGQAATRYQDDQESFWKFAGRITSSIIMGVVMMICIGLCYLAVALWCFFDNTLTPGRSSRAS